MRGSLQVLKDWDQIPHIKGAVADLVQTLISRLTPAASKPQMGPTKDHRRSKEMHPVGSLRPIEDSHREVLSEYQRRRGSVDSRLGTFNGLFTSQL